MRRKIRELAAAIFVVLGIGLMVLAYFWFSGRIETARRRTVVVYFPDVTGLRVSDPVEVLGLPSGKVTRLELDQGRIRSELLVDRTVTLTTDTRLAIRSVSYLGSERCIMIRLGSGPPAPDGHVFEGTNEALDLEETFLRLDRMMEQLDPEQLTIELRNAGREILDAVSAELTRLNAGLGGLNQGFASTAGELSMMTARIDSITRLFDEASTAGRLLSSDELYQELRTTNETLNALLEDVRLNPKRYLKFSLF